MSSDPLDYSPSEINVDHILPMKLPSEEVDALLDKLEQEIQNSGSVKEILEVLGAAGKFAIKLGVQVAAKGLAGGALGDLGELGA